MSNRTNEQWLAALNSNGLDYSDALESLRALLERGLFYYLHNERSDLSSRSVEDIQQMAQDFTQDALLKILDNLDTFRGESKFTTWATKIAARIAISELRRVRYKNYSLDHLTADGEIMPDITSLVVTPEKTPNPEHFTERQEILARIDSAIEEVLTERQRLALTAFIMDGIPVDELAQRMNTNRNALYKLMHDARLKLKDHMKEQGLSMDYILDLFAST